MLNSLEFQAAIALMNNDFLENERLEKIIEEEKFKIIISKKKIRTIGKYATFRKEVLKKGNYKCAKCESTEKLEVHHLKMVSIYPELAFDTDNGIILCHKCHKREHSKGNKNEH